MTDELLPFKADRRCEKCGCDEARWEYVKAGTYVKQDKLGSPGLAGEEEHLRKNCARCGFEWCEKVISKEELQIPLTKFEDAPISSSDLSNRAFKRLTQAGIHTFKDLANTPVTKLLSMKGMGRGTVLEIEHKLNQRGLYLRKS